MLTDLCRCAEQTAEMCRAGGKGLELVDSQAAAAAVQEVASATQLATERGPATPLSVPPMQRQAWADWMQEQAATAQAAAAQATAVAASAAAAVAESGPHQTPTPPGPPKLLQKLVADLERFAFAR